MSKGSLDFKLFEFTPEIQRLMGEIEANTNEDGEWVGGARPFEDIVQDIMNMEHAKKDKVLGIGHLILHLKECMERHQAHSERHAKKAKSFENNIERLKSYIKGNTGEADKFKDDFVSIYPMKTSACIPLVPVDQLPVIYKRPKFAPAAEIDRNVVARLDAACARQDVPSPFRWEPDVETLKKDVKDAEAAKSNHPYGRLEHGRTVVIRG